MEVSVSDQQEVVSRLYDEGYLVTNDVMSLVKKGFSYQTIISMLDRATRKDVQTSFSESHVSVNVVKSYVDNHKEVTTQDFIDHFAVRLQKLSAILRRRSELENVISINRLVSKQDREKTSIIGFVKDKSITKNEHISLLIEDKTGDARVLILKRDGKEDLYNQAKNLVLDDVVGICGSVAAGTKDKIIFADTILLPDIPNTNEYKKCPDDVRAVFIGDLHIGAKVFLEKEFNHFLDWLNEKSEDEALNAIARKVRYVVIVGDIIEGAGVYPGQEHDLTVMDVRDQYKLSATFISRIPKHMHIIICPGNHDTMRLSEPQPPLSKEYAKDLVEIPNVICVSSPSVVNIHKFGDFPGFNILLYHGYSFFYYINSVEEIRTGGGIERIDLVMEFLLRRRHLAPSHTSTLYLPDPDRDELIIETVPDFFVTGHIHKSVVKNYKNITLLNCSCFVDVTDYQKKQGMIPDLAKVAVINLQTRETQLLDFLQRKQPGEE
ncbi:MAG TPA: metallophosphoesterase [Acidobacteriota bacterium]|nr:metallophosphoesterase [Acidobacteriota bacterium]